MNINIMNEKCTGCGACQYVCPKKCIEMQTNDIGFRYPVLKENECIDCGICLKNCHLTNENVIYNKQKVYAAHSINNEIYKNSASGGIATTISKKFIEDGGIVYGCSLDEDFNTKHIRVDTVRDLYLIQDSKYTQSNMENIFEQLKKDLEDNKLILFISTPCQVSAVLLNFAKYKNQIYTIDLICHGVTNDSIFKSYISYLEKKENIKIIKYIYRSKKSSEYERTETIKYLKRGKMQIKIKKLVDSIYYYSYLEGIISRTSCLDCKYKLSNRYGDITLGDYWGYNNEFGSKENKMFSKVVINNEKGKKLFYMIDKSINFKESYHDLQFSKKDNTNQESSNHDVQKMAINGEWKNIKKINYNKKFYMKKIYKFIPTGMKRVINRIINK